MADNDEAPVELVISPEKIGFIIVKARDFDAKDVVTDPDDSSILGCHAPSNYAQWCNAQVDALEQRALAVPTQAAHSDSSQA